MRISVAFAFLFHCGTIASAQSWTLDTIGNLPEAVSNNAVAYGEFSGDPYAFSFSGIGSGKAYADIHLKSYRCNLRTGLCDTLPPLPDTLGKVAAGATKVGDIIYIIGGYHVFSDGGEKSSELVHRFHIPSQSYLTNATPIPVPIDDHVQVVYRDSLIYCITGWSENQNVNDVQVYDIENDTWLVGTPVPNNSLYESFGPSGTLVGDTIVYFGGARFGANFPAQNILRKGGINPSNPLDITWSFSIPSDTIFAYRSAAETFMGTGVWFGGSSITFNYDGIAYNGSGGVSPQEACLTLLPNGTWEIDYIQGLPMDLRGLARASETDFYFVGGMMRNQEVSNQVLKLSYGPPSGVDEMSNSVNDLVLYPNPCSDGFSIENFTDGVVQILTLDGSAVLEQNISNSTAYVSVESLSRGMYIVRYSGTNGSFSTKLNKL